MPPTAESQRPSSDPSQRFLSSGSACHGWTEARPYSILVDSLYDRRGLVIRPTNSLYDRRKTRYTADAKLVIRPTPRRLANLAGSRASRGLQGIWPRLFSAC